MEDRFYAAIPAQPLLLQDRCHHIRVGPSVILASVWRPKVEGCSLVNRPVSVGTGFGFQIHERFVEGRIQLAVRPRFPLSRLVQIKSLRLRTTKNDASRIGAEIQVNTFFYASQEVGP